MHKHSAIRLTVADALRAHLGGTQVYDGRPVFLEESELPVVAVYLTDASPTDDVVDEDLWQAVLHIEVFLKASNPDSKLDEWMEDKIYPAMQSVPALAGLIETMSAAGYDYQRDDEMCLWGSADLTYHLTYSM
ncbi:phage minor tail U family protein [Morganella morganii]|uniref:phage minor tail U family protein n=1 Tax=Morganella morganii TaxID=582 RepID=UPI0016445F3D|nr:phage minor tail U family protein [Morganella morganii]MBC4001898.1 phage tail protein [Morganella morganii]